ncbi:MAG: efflux RND transporter periplasmic adaptor subunit [Microscillaceae bacterium]|nr:efflux RND transporter periplasmic adaptor subunit [Microscillaceae bacterium]
MARKKKSNKLLRNLIIIVVILVIGAFIARSAGWIGKEPLVKVQTSIVKKLEITEQVTASGKVQPETEVKISSDVSGEVIEVTVEEGDSVIQGQLLFRIRPDNIQAVVESARATVNSRQANFAQAQADLSQRKAQLLQTKVLFDRNKDLYNQKVISLADYQTAETNYQVALEQVNSAKENVEAARYNLQNSQATLRQNLDNLSRTEIYAPTSGIVSKLSVEKGEKVVGTGQMAGTEMMILADLNNMEVQVDVNENDIVKVRRGQKAIIDVDSYSASGRKFEGIVTEIANTANTTTSADAVTEFEVKVRILKKSFQDLIGKDSKRPAFRPGMTASVDIITNTKSGILGIPIAAVTTRDKSDEADKNIGRQVNTANNSNQNEDKKKEEEIKEIVFVYDPKEGKVIQKEVQTGISDFENMEIIKGLKLGEEVVSGPFILVSKQLKDGQKVEKEKIEDLKKEDK